MEAQNITNKLTAKIVRASHHLHSCFQFVLLLHSAYCKFELIWLPTTHVTIPSRISLDAKTKVIGTNRLSKYLDLP